MTFDAEEILRALARHDVAYVIVGGLAVQTHGHPRTTQDLDLIPRPEPSNYDRLAKALQELEATPLGAPAKDVEASPLDPERPRIAAVAPPFATRHGSVHVLNDVPGAAPYDALRRRALDLEIAGVSVAVAGIDDLVSMKRAAGRRRDLEDIAALTKAPRDDG